MMAPAQSLTHSRTPKQVREYINGLMCASVSAQLQSDPTRVSLATTAMSAPRMTALRPFSFAWRAAMLMLDCYAVIPLGGEQRLMSTYGVQTLEEAVEGQMRDGCFPDKMTERAFQLASLSALHSLNWARQHPAVANTTFPARRA